VTPEETLQNTDPGLYFHEKYMPKQAHFKNLTPFAETYLSLKGKRKKRKN